MGKDTELKRSRDWALYEVYKKGLQDQRFSTQKEAINWVFQQPAPQFFLSSKSLAVHLGELTRTGSLPVYEATREKILRLAEMYQQYIDEHPDSGLSKDLICEALVESPAPSFYASKETIRKIIQRGMRDDRLRILRRYSR